MANGETEARRAGMVENQIAARGVKDSAVLAAMERVPRERFVAPEMVEFAYEDSPLPIDEEQTISQPYVVAVMSEALELAEDDRVLEIGTGSGYAAAVLAQIAAEVYTVERHRALAESAERRFSELGYDNVHVRHGDGTLGWEEHAPYDAIVVAAGGRKIPEALKAQLAPGGRLVIPTGPTPRTQELVRARRQNGDLVRENLGAVRFVPLIGEGGWKDGGDGPEGRSRAEAEEPAAATGPAHSLPDLVRRAAEPFPSIEDADLDGFLERVGDARVVLLGEASHGTSEFYRMRARITEALIRQKGFDFVAVEADWPDAANLDHFVRHRETPPPLHTPFTRFPTWMWANHEVRDFVERLRSLNEGREIDDRVGFFGLDLYSLYASIARVLAYLDEEDPDAAEVARARYGCLTPWEGDPAAYGRAAITGRYRECEEDVVAALRDLLARRLEHGTRDRFRFLDAVQNARLVANAEQYYRVMYYGSTRSWNVRDQHMFDTLVDLLGFHGPESRAVVWAHNSHLGDASATEMGARGQHNLGDLCRRQLGPEAYLVGFGTHTGTVAAAPDWGAPMEVMDVRPSHEASYERICHDAETDRFLLPLREGQADPTVRVRLLEARLERAIGVVYRPSAELRSHYFQSVLPRQFDEWIWFDRSEAVTPLEREADVELTPETFPFGV